MIPAWEILQQLLTQCADPANVDLGGQGTAPGIVDATTTPARSNIFAVSVPYSRDARDRFAGAINARPALVFAAPRRIPTNQAGGDDQKRDRTYTFLAQVLDTDISVHSSDKLYARFKWEYNLSLYFDQMNLKGQVFNTSDGMVWNSVTTDSDLLDDRLFHLFDDCVALIPLSFRCLEPYDLTGRG